MLGPPVEIVHEHRDPLDVGGRNAGTGRRPLGRAVGQQGLELVEADRVPLDVVAVDQAVARDHVHQPEREGGVGAGPWLEVDVRARSGRRLDRVDDNDGAPQSGADEGCSDVTTPGQPVQEETNPPTQPNTAAAGRGGEGRPDDGAWLLIVVLAGALAAFVMATPARSRKRQ